MEEDTQDGTLVLPIFKKKKASSNRKEKLNSRNKTSLEAGDTANDAADQQAQEDGNTVISRISKKSVLAKATPTKPIKSRISLGSVTDESFDLTNSPKSSSRRKLARPGSQASLNDLSTEFVHLIFFSCHKYPQFLTKLNLHQHQSSISSSPLSRTLSESSRPTYSNAHLNELKSLTLSSAPRSNEYTGDDDLTRSKYPSHDTLEDEDMSFVSNNESIHIPTSNFINSAKERRSQARKIGISTNQISEPSSAEDFISLSAKSSSLLPSTATKKGESRLVREEDQFGEGDDEHAEYTGAKERVPLGEKAGLAAEASKKAGMEAMIMDAEVDLDEGNEEEMEWEAAQIRRGGIGDSAEKITSERKAEIYKAAPIPEHASLASLASVENDLSRLLNLLEESVAEQNSAALQFSAEEKSLTTQESELRQEVTREVQRADFFDDLNNFVKEIDLFFTKKWPQLEKVERDLISILTERAELIFKRRYEDLSDDLVLFKDGEIGILRPSSSKPSSSRPDESELGKGEQESEVDELGRSRPELDLSPHAPSRTSRRNDRAHRRKRKMAAALAENKTVGEDDEGFSTDDSLSPADSSDLQSASRCLHDSAKEILIDIANPVFLSPTHKDSISDRFLSWRFKYPDDYGNAFGNLALVQAWEFWVRVEMVTGLNIWGLREWVKSEDKRGIENWEWMRGLEQYEHAVQSGPQHDSVDNQESVVAAMISTVVIPLFLPLIRCSYDPFSTRATTKSLQLAEQVSYVLETEGNPTYDKFIKCFLDRFRSSVDELKRLVGSSRELGEKLRSQVGVEGIQARKRFLNKSLKLFKQGLRWKKFFGKNYWLHLDQLDDLSDRGQTDNGTSLPLDFKYLWETGGQQISEKITAKPINPPLN
ncbi:hypothetical protein VP01_846g3 [Puccinia sorghi]|uniref:GCF C-terminal domain-containing protein n=1 Tax=Puccinia sorghi TaxID=27349 RepID=A0A0L6U9D1_9BASI|nr:hypothetical protein VP01_846g3 [Puccinia sorghi]